MSDLQTNSTSKIVAGILAGAITSYTMNWLSLSGVNFETLGVDSEIIKSSLIGTLVGFFVGFTPKNMVDGIISLIIFIRSSWRKIVLAATSSKLPEEEK